jgi:hypothetical protein
LDGSFLYEQGLREKSPRPKISNQSQRSDQYENMDQSGRSARHHHWVQLCNRPGLRCGGQRGLRQMLQDKLQILLQVCGRQVRVLLQELTPEECQNFEAKAGSDAKGAGPARFLSQSTIERCPTTKISPHF